MSYRIAQISDTHLSRAKPFFVENFLRIGEALRVNAPDLVVNSGDITLNGAAQEDDLVSARRLHESLGLPVRFIPGNHDLGDAQDVPSHGESSIDPVRRTRYVKHFGLDWWWFDVPGWRVLGIDSLLLGSDLAEAAEQEGAIADAMTGIGERRLALFLHKPLFDRRPDEGAVTGRFVNPMPRRRLLGLLRSPALVASGHVHQYRESENAGTRHVWAPSTACVLPDRVQPRYGLKRVGYVEHTLVPDGRHACRMIEVPGAETLDIADFPDAYGPV